MSPEDLAKPGQIVFKRMSPSLKKHMRIQHMNVQYDCVGLLVLFKAKRDVLITWFI